MHGINHALSAAASVPPSADHETRPASTASTGPLRNRSGPPDAASPARTCSRPHLQRLPEPLPRPRPPQASDEHHHAGPLGRATARSAELHSPHIRASSPRPVAPDLHRTLQLPTSIVAPRTAAAAAANSPPRTSLARPPQRQREERRPAATFTGACTTFAGAALRRRGCREGRGKT